jgi:hypothetical protein
MTTTFKGGCLCGKLRYEATAEPIMAGHCHCADCQKNSGSGHADHIMFPRAAVKIAGKAAEYKSKADSGNTVTRSFCPNCGSPVFGTSSGMPDMMTVRAGSLDDPELFKPQLAVYAVRRRKWDHMDPALPAFERMPPMPA